MSDDIKTMALSAPNHYSLTGSEVHVSFATSGPDGEPMLNYQDSFRMSSFAGEQIRLNQGDLGLVVSVSIMQTVDAGHITFSVMLPAVNLPGGQPVHIETIGVTTFHRFSIIFPLMGQLETYSSISMVGTAAVINP